MIKLRDIITFTQTAGQTERGHLTIHPADLGGTFIIHDKIFYKSLFNLDDLRILTTDVDHGQVRLLKQMHSTKSMAGDLCDSLISIRNNRLLHIGKSHQKD